MTKRFRANFDVSIFDSETEEYISVKREKGLEKLAGLLNHLHEENEQLRQELQKKQEEERLYANEIVELNKTKNEMLNFKELGGDY